MFHLSEGLWNELNKTAKTDIWYGEICEGAIAVICGSMLINDKKDLSELKRAVNEIYRLNDALRIRISETDGEVSQTVTEYT